MQTRFEDGAPLTRRAMLSMGAIAPALVMGMAGTEALAQGDAADQAPELAAAWHAYDRATAGSDVATLSSLVTDDYMLVNSDSSVQDKQSYLADFGVPGFRLDPYEIEQPIQRLWGDTALTGSLFNLAWVQDGRNQRRLLRVAHIWTRQDGRWRIAYTQLTRVPE